MLPTSKNMTNGEIARLLRQVAAAFEVKQHDYFRVRAYQNAAASIEHATQSLRDIWEEGKLKDVPGIGASLAEHLDELFRTGKVRHFASEVKSLPAGMFALLGLPNVGPKTAYRLAKEFGLNDPKTAQKHLLAAVKAGRMAKLEGFGTKSETQLLESLKAEEVKPKSAIDRLLLPEAEALANDVIEYLKQDKSVLGAEYLGSLRRKAATIGDVDLVVKTRQPETVIAHLKRFPRLSKLVASGPNMTTFRHASGRQVDVKLGSPENWGSLLQHFTGSKFHNITLRTWAIKKKLSLSEQGINVRGRWKPFATEEAFYKFLGMQCPAPELREDTGEIQAAIAHKLPQLVEIKDIKGDLHIHTPIDIHSSHDTGHSPIEDILKRAVELDYDYIGFADHNPRLRDLPLNKKLEVLKRRNERIEQEVYSAEKTVKRKLTVFKGLEVDIRPDGTLALEDQALELLDYAIASVHANFTQTKEVATKRVLKGLAHPKVRIFGHPTGRKLQKREGIDYDWSELFAFCVKHKKLLEINGTPDRLDLPDMLVREGVRAGVDFIIDSDTHETTHLDFMRWGVYVARRGWAERKNIANTLPLAEFKHILLGKKN